jgi:hypothetical protein
MKTQPNMYHKPKEEVFIFALLPARASLMPAKSMTPTTTTTTAAAVVVAAATEGRRAYHIFWRGEMKK